MSRLFPCLVLLVSASTSFAQVVYEPVKYQFDSHGTTYYYGGTDLRIHAIANEPHSAGATWGRVNGYDFVSADLHVHREVSNQPARVFTDAVRNRDAAPFGFTADDARNEAYANVPRYFVKRDVPGMAVVKKDGSWSVPAAAVPVRVFKSNGQEIQIRSTPQPKPLLIIPKDMLQKPLPSDKQMVRAD
ncbi:MAG TPA: hypothetical protein VHD56_01730 [Tepidisphaeraceae bacterium]|nr:hypothetical protein [Tepidisphaeraceae bacterium]